MKTLEKIDTADNGRDWRRGRVSCKNVYDEVQANLASDPRVKTATMA